MTAWLVVAFVPAAISCALAWALARARLARRLADVPNERSLHSSPTPRVGGLGILAGSMPFALAHGSGSVEVALGAALFLAAVSLADDVRSLPVFVRLAAHFVAAVAVIGSASGLDMATLPAAAVACVALVWVTNLFNFMDGADGLAGGMAVVGFSTFAAVAASSLLGLPSLAIASGCAGFLLLNFPPARLFMGDAGSIPLGFLAAAFAWVGIAQGLWPGWFPVLVFSPFVADASVTIVRRAWRREAIWRAHRAHYYQRLVLAGWSRRRLVLWAYAVMLGAAGSAVAALRVGGIWPYVIIAAWTATYALLFLAIDRRVPWNGARERRPEPRSEP